MKKILVVIDMQNDFITGELGTDESKDIVANVVEKIKQYNTKKDKIIFTMDTHFQNYLDTQEGKKLNIMHCIQGSHGHDLHDDIKNVINKSNSSIILKTTFGNFIWDDIANGDDIEICGVCTDICVVSNAIILKTKFPDSKIIIDSLACAGTSIKNHNDALNIMRACQIDVL